jgi:DUF4097 and DUF4098 domain-containing protein YvlB
MYIPAPEPLRVLVSGGAGDITVSCHDETFVELAPDGCAWTLEPWGVAIRPRETLAIVVPAISELELIEVVGDIWIGVAPSGVLVSGGVGEVEFAEMSSSARISGRTGDVIAHHMSGRMAVVECRGDVTISEVTGDVRVRDCVGDVLLGEMAGTARISGCSGDLSVTNLSGFLRAAAGPGDVVMGVLSGSAEVRSQAGSLRINRVARSGTVTATTTSGDIVIRRARGPVTLDTASGDISIDWLDPTSAVLSSGSGQLAIGVPVGVDVQVDHSGVTPTATLSNELGLPSPSSQAAVSPSGGAAGHRPATIRLVAGSGRARLHRV